MVREEMLYCKTYLKVECVLRERHQTNCFLGLNVSRVCTYLPGVHVLLESK